MDTRAYNREAWNREVEGGENRWSQPVDAETIAKAKQGEFSILLTENIPVPQKWFPPLKGADVLCLASGGGSISTGGTGRRGGMAAEVCAGVMEVIGLSV